MLRKRVLCGTAYEIGAALGRSLKGLPVPRATWEEAAFGRACRDAAEKTFPQAIETFTGIVDASGLEGEDFQTYYFARREGMLRGCTAFAVAPPTHRAVIVGRNYDWVYSDQKWCEVRVIRQEGAIPIMGYTHHWAGLPDALNEEGLFIAIAALPKRPPNRPGLQWNLIVDAMTSTCGTAAEAAAILTSVSHLRAMAYLAVDGSGRALVVEAGPDRVSVRSAIRDQIVVTNHRLDEIPGTDRERRSLRRYERATQLLHAYAGRLDEDAAKTILSDHQAGICSGPHGDDRNKRNGGFGTIWSSVCRPDRRALEIAPGHPCRKQYERVDFGMIGF